ncbi:MAG: nuclear transport factor 2 family protein [Proteobacteria bacterium]|nr:nuclear transport factor 2 family protein [Pseudomonadota bacterium]
MRALIAPVMALTAAPVLAADAPTPAYPGAPADLARAAIAFDRAQVKGDGAALTDLLADDYLLVNSQDQRETKAQFIADYTAPGFTMDPFAIDDQVIKVCSDGAILGGVVTMTGMSDGKPYSVRLRFTDVWAKRGGKWRVIFTHANRVAAKP